MTTNNDSIDTCLFCVQLHKKDIDANLFLSHASISSVLNTLESRWIFQTENFSVTPDLSPIVEGHLLIVTNKHVLSTEALNSKKKTELEETKQLIRELFKLRYDSPATFFEHGSSSYHEEAGACIRHAHIHAIPQMVDLKKEFDTFEFAKICNPRSEEIRLRSVDYVLLEDYQGVKTLYCNHIFPSQILRKCMTILLRAGAVRWQDGINIQLMLKTLNDLSVLYKTKF